MHVKAGLAGASIALSVLATALGGFVAFSPGQTLFSPLARVLDAYAPHLLLLGFVLGGLGWFLRARLAGGLAALIAMILGLWLTAAYLAVTSPGDPDARADLRVLWFNLREDNTTDPGTLLDALLASKADIVVLAEASFLAGALSEVFSFVSPCPGGNCGLLVATRQKSERFWRLSLNPVWEGRYAVIELGTPDGRLVFVSAVHLAKPWMSVVADVERARLTAQYNWFDGPVIAVGDFNMPPWSQPMRKILQDTGFQALRWQPATWPAHARGLRLPIDQVLLRGGPAIVSVRTFGSELGSNHLGIIADISLEPASAEADE
ncbi:MAG: endonuclease/exonuclease/phosphatase family protein [Pseudomonadota bacterium]